MSTAAPQLRLINRGKARLYARRRSREQSPLYLHHQNKRELYVENAAGCWGDAQQRAYLLANEHNTPMTLIARNASGGKDQFFTAYPDSWFDEPVQAG
jgi:hypothetical protein